MHSISLSLLPLILQCPGDLDFRFQGKAHLLTGVPRSNVTLKLYAPYDLSFEYSGMMVSHKAITMTDYYRLMRPFVSRSIIPGHTRCGFDTPTVSALQVPKLPFPDLGSLLETTKPHEYISLKVMAHGVLVKHR